MGIPSLPKLIIQEGSIPGIEIKLPRREFIIMRNMAVSKAEGLIKRFHEDFGWAFVNKDDSGAFWSKIIAVLGVQALIITILRF